MPNDPQGPPSFDFLYPLLCSVRWALSLLACASTRSHRNRLVPKCVDGSNLLQRITIWIASSVKPPNATDEECQNHDHEQDESQQGVIYCHAELTHSQRQQRIWRAREGNGQT